MAEPAIETRDLVRDFVKRGGGLPFTRKSGGEVTRALDGVNLSVERGELFGLLGPNRAGKTTLVKILSTLLVPTSGEARILGHDCAREADAVRRRIGVVLGGERALYWRLTARENLRYFADLYDIPRRVASERIDRLLDRVDLLRHADERVESFSRGMKQRLHIARGLLNEPDVLLLDEPSIGLDPVAARELRALVRELHGEGRTIVLTTHYLYEADALSERVAIIKDGRLVALDTPAALKGKAAGAGALVLRVRDAPASLERDLGGLAGVRAVVLDEGSPGEAPGYRLELAGASKEAEEVGVLAAEAVRRSGGRLLALSREEPSLEDVFVSLTGVRLASSEGEGQGARAQGGGSGNGHS